MLIRSVLAAAAVLATVLVAGGIEGLADHYHSQSQASISQPLLVAGR
jgi:outer membrane murein-binding lipoprotein Lpp